MVRDREIRAAGIPARETFEKKRAEHAYDDED
jgi:hypothetical protein